MRERESGADAILCVVLVLRLQDSDVSNPGDPVGAPKGSSWSPQYPPALHVSKFKWGLLPALKRDHLDPSAGIFSLQP